MLERFVRPLKEECTDFEDTFCASFLKQADALASSRAILEAFIGPVRDLLGRNILDCLGVEDVDALSVAEVHALLEFSSSS